MAYSNSPLVNYTRISPNKNINRNHAIDRITPHCYVGQVSVNDMGAWLCNPGAKASANYGIGTDGRVGLFVEEKDRSWCSSSAENDNRAVTIECASATYDPYEINSKVYDKLIQLCIDICRRNGKDCLIWFGSKEKTLSYDPKPNEMILSVHRWFANKACPGAYIYNRLNTIAETVTSALRGVSGVPVDKYVVRLSFEQPATQTNSYNNLTYAKAEADRHPGYSVYVAETGECVYTSLQELGYTPDEWIAMFAPICTDLAKKTQVLPSVVIAQTALETGWGTTDLTRKYNVLGMKTDLINSTWKEHSTWGGEVYRKVTPEYYNGQLTYVEDDFRVYSSFRQCVEDYENFLLYVRNNKGYKYRRLQGKTDPAEVINIIRVGTGTNSKPEGYCTDPAYETKILKIIKDYDLTRFDSGMTEAKDIYYVQRSLDETQFRLGKFHVLENAKRQADEHWGYKVFNIESGKCVYEPVLSKVQKLIAKCLQFNDFVLWDIKNSRIWRYYNNKRSANTFWATRDQHLYMTNCMGGCYFCWIDIGIPASALQWYGTPGGIHWLNNHAKADAEKYFDFIEANGKTVKKCIADGTLQPGDGVTYEGMAHTNIYLGNGTSFDTGHAFCNGSGEGAKYQKWVGEVPHQSSKVAVIVRMKAETKKLVYRVQIGAMKTEKSANAVAAECKKRTKPLTEDGEGLGAFSEKMSDGKWHVFCGSFEHEAGASERLALLKKPNLYPDAFIKQVYI